MNLGELKNFLDKWLIEKAKYDLNDLFSTSRLKLENIKNFLFEKSNEKHIVDLLLDVDKNYNDSMYYKNLLLLLEINDLSRKDITCLRLLIKCVCINAVINHSFFKIEKLNSKKIELVLNEYDKDSGRVYFRGQSNSEWGIIPSVFRNHIFSSNNHYEYFDVHSLYDRYNSSGLIDKYNKTIANVKIKCSNDLTYDFVSYMQHSIAYSPLIDLTSKVEIGLQFALGNKSSINEFFGKDAALFALRVKNKDNIIDVEEATNLLKKDFKVIVMKEIVPAINHTVLNSYRNNVQLDFIKVDNILKALRPKYKIIETALNDRMRYQHGKFILFYDYVLAGNKVLYHLNKDLEVSIYTIPKKSKEKIYNMIDRLYFEYNMDYMMNPYDYFKK